MKKQNLISVYGKLTPDDGEEFKKLGKEMGWTVNATVKKAIEYYLPYLRSLAQKMKKA